MRLKKLNTLTPKVMLAEKGLTIKMGLDELLEQFWAGDRRACGQLISMVENDNQMANEILNKVYNRIGRAYRIGVTGPPGAGKSTLVEKIALRFRQDNLTVGIVAVDPSSPFSGGAILGDRVRMAELFLDPGVFIRSMATRGSLGGLASKTKEVCDLLDAFGQQIIITETIGVGQVELDVAEASFTTIVVLVPESGDSIQTLKAGLMEIGDIFVVNKSDREGSDRLALEIEMVLEMRNKSNQWHPPVIKTIATENTGIEELYSSIVEHRNFLKTSNLLNERKAKNIRHEIIELVETRIKKRMWQLEKVQKRLEELVTEVMRGNTTPFLAADAILKEWQDFK
ncbi:MAG: methylmalonyl Co-A mutase-associated GTPase MeaB [candidate division WOR-3 bacterium]